MNFQPFRTLQMGNRCIVGGEMQRRGSVQADKRRSARRLRTTCKVSPSGPSDWLLSPLVPCS